MRELFLFKTFSDHARIVFLLVLMAAVAVLSAGISIWSLYRTAFDEVRSRLVETVQSQARLVEAVARFDAIHSQSVHPEGAAAATLSQVIDAHKNYEGFGETGEFALARREGNQIVFLLSHRHYDHDTPKPVAWDSDVAEPMRQALSGRSGTILGLDYRGVLVLAAFEPVAVLELGMVAKIDLAEIRRPFLIAMIVSGIGVLLIIALGVEAGRRVSIPFLERKKAEENLRELNEQLEVRVERRTADLRAAQNELLRQERLATVGRLMATVSHELRNPLSAITLSQFTLRKILRTTDQRVAEALDRLEQGAASCGRIVNELLDYTRTGRLEPESTPIDDFLSGVLDEQVLPRGISLHRELGLPGISVPLDRYRFRRAVINIFDNACQAIAGARENEDELDEKTLSVRTRRAGGRIEVIFEDDGPGMPEDVLEKIFEPLFSTKSFGVGLGLPIVKQIMEQHGGGIGIETKEGQGTRICLWFPLEPSIAQASGQTDR